MSGREDEPPDTPDIVELPVSSETSRVRHAERQRTDDARGAAMAAAEDVYSAHAPLLRWIARRKFHVPDQKRRTRLPLSTTFAAPRGKTAPMHCVCWAGSMPLSTPWTTPTAPFAPAAPLGPAITMHLRAIILYDRGEYERALGSLAIARRYSRNSVIPSGI